MDKETIKLGQTIIHPYTKVWTRPMKKCKHYRRFIRYPYYYPFHWRPYYSDVYVRPYFYKYDPSIKPYALIEKFSNGDGNNRLLMTIIFIIVIILFMNYI